MSKFLLSMYLIFSANIVWGATDTDLLSLLAQARQDKIAQHPYWLALVHYRQTGLGLGVKSEVITPEFFLSPRGSVDPERELEATLTAFFELPTGGQNDHAQCRFVARYDWLRKKLDWREIKIPAADCAEYDSWRKQGNTTSVSLIFATGYFSNPASFYGHILLRFNTNRSVIKTNLLDESLNFGAIVPEGDGPLSYISKGIFGQYDAAFSSTGFYRLNHIYAEEELRDMWAYELALTHEELEQIIAHSWELLKVKFAYYYFKENCAFRMAELLELVIGEPLFPPSLPWSIPISVFDHLVAIERNGKSLVAEINRIPSRLNSFREQYKQLNTFQRRVISDFVNKSQSFEKTEYSSMSMSEQIVIIDTLRDYYQFRIVVDSENIDLQRIKRDLLIRRSGLTDSKGGMAVQESAESAASVPPHFGSPPGMVRMGMVHNSQLGMGVALQLRPAYFDNLGLEAGRTPNATLTMFDVTATYLRSRWNIRNFDVVNIEHLNIAQTPLSGDGGWAWKVRFGAESANLSCGSCSVAHLTGGIGKAVKIADELVAYTMMNGVTRNRYLDEGTLIVRPVIGMLAMPYEGWKSSLVLSRQVSVNGSRPTKNITSWENRFGVARDWDVRVSYHYNVSREWKASISTYW